MSNITVFLDNNALIYDRPAVVDPSEGLELTFRDLLTRMSRTARALEDKGIRKGDRVCIYLDSCPEYLISYFAIWRLGAVAVPANISLREDELLHLVTDAGARILICDDSGTAVAGVAAGRSAGICSVLNISRVKATPEGEGVVPPVNCGPDDLIQLPVYRGNDRDSQRGHAHPWEPDGKP